MERYFVFDRKRLIWKYNTLILGNFPHSNLSVNALQQMDNASVLAIAQKIYQSVFINAIRIGRANHINTRLECLDFVYTPHIQMRSFLPFIAGTDYEILDKNNQLLLPCFDIKLR